MAQEAGKVETKSVNPYSSPKAMPLAELGLDPAELGLDPSTVVNVQVWTHPGARTTEEAAAFYHDYGIAVLASDFKFVDRDSTVADLDKEFVAPALELFIKYSDNPEIVEPKNLHMEDGSVRAISIVKHQNVVRYFEPVEGLHKLLLPTYQAMGGPRTIISEDETEKSVINAMIYDPKASDTDVQTHGFHIDRVDVTGLKPIVNVGPGGETALAVGYPEACKKYGLYRHGDVKKNLGHILAEDPNAITFRLHPAVPGIFILFHSDKYFHFVMPKKNADIKAALAAGAQAPKLPDGRFLTRLILNDAAESGECQDNFELAKNVENWLASPDAEEAKKTLQGTVLMAAAFRAVGVPEEQYESVENAVIGRKNTRVIYEARQP